jgi:hypothetical protein
VGILAITLPSETLFAFELKSHYFFGLPVSVSPGGLAMDADRLLTLAKALDGSNDKPIQYFLSQGTNSSALEHAVPEQLFSTSENPSQGISAVKALKLANDQGIPIYTINKSNIATVLPQLQLDSETLGDIQNAVNAGMIVTAPGTDISFNGWTGCGYIIIDPSTGAGAYMISGGMSGGWWLVLEIALLLFIIVAGSVLVGFAIAGIAFVIANLGVIIAAITAFLANLSLWLSAAVLSTPYLGRAIQYLYAALVEFNNVYPSPPWDLPVPTTWTELAIYLHVLRDIIINEMRKKYFSWIGIEKLYFLVWYNFKA